MFYKNPHFPKTIFLILCLVLCNTVSKAQHAPFEVTLWPSTPPGNSGLTGPETIDEHGFVHNVTLPSLLVYPAAQEKNTGMAVLIAPGGGYSFLAINHEGKEIAQWLAGNGITGVVLKYSCLLYTSTPDTLHSSNNKADDSLRIIRFIIYF